MSLSLSSACSSDATEIPPDGDDEIDQASDGDDIEGSDGDDETDSLGESDLEPDLEPELEAEEEDFALSPIDPAIIVDDLILSVQDDEPEPELPDGVRLRAGTYNIYGGNFADAEAIGSFLGGLDLDLVGLQECPADMVAPMALAGGFDHYIALGGKGLLSRTAFGAVEDLPLPTRARSILHTTTIIEGVQFSVYNAHISWDAGGDKECRLFVDQYLSQDPIKHLLMMGDFNDEHYSSQNKILEELVIDAFTSYGWYPGQRISWPSVGFDDTEGSVLIDLFFFSKDLPAIVVTADVINQSPVLSDHKPTLVELLYPRDDTPFTVDPYAARRDVWRGFPPEDQRPDNLLINPGAEDGVEAWELSGGAVVAQQREQQGPRKGTSFFTGFETAPDEETRHSSGSQSVDLSAQAEMIDKARAVLYASAWMVTGYRTDTAEPDIVSNLEKPYDEGEVVVEVLDQAGDLLLRRSSGWRDTLGYHPFAAALDLPPGSRTAGIRFTSHHKKMNGPGNDAVFDDFYLALANAESRHTRLGGNMISNPGAEAASVEGWETDGWRALPDLGFNGLIFFPMLSYSGMHFFYAGGEFGLTAGDPEIMQLSQMLDIEDYRVAIQKGEFALRWGAKLRSYQAHTSVEMALEIYDSDGSLWGIVPSEPVFAAEWTAAENLTLIPPGTLAVKLLLSADVGQADSAAFVDEVFALPEQLK